MSNDTALTGLSSVLHAMLTRVLLRPRTVGSIRVIRSADSDLESAFEKTFLDYELTSPFTVSSPEPVEVGKQLSNLLD